MLELVVSIRYAVLDYKLPGTCTMSDLGLQIVKQTFIMNLDLFKLKKHMNYHQQRLSICRDKRLGMRVRTSIDRSEQQRFRIFSAIQIADAFKKILQEVSQ